MVAGACGWAQAQLESSESRADTANESLHAAKGKIQELTSQLRAAQEELQSSQKASSQAAAEATSLRDEFQASKLRGDAAQEALRAAELKVQELQDRLAARAASPKAAEQAAALKREVQASKQRLQALEAEVEAGRREREELADLLQASHAEAKHLNRQLNNLAGQQAADLETGAKLRAELDAAEGRIGEIASQLRAAENELVAASKEATMVREGMASTAKALRAIIRGEQPAPMASCAGVPELQQVSPLLPCLLFSTGRGRPGHDYDDVVVAAAGRSAEKPGGGLAAAA